MFKESKENILVPKEKENFRNRKKEEEKKGNIFSRRTKEIIVSKNMKNIVPEEDGNISLEPERNSFQKTKTNIRSIRS